VCLCCFCLQRILKSRFLSSLPNSNSGPMSTPSMNGCLYYVIFIDDFSRKSWIYFLKAKNETFSKFLEFKALIEK
jgi:hypothetical protein